MAWSECYLEFGPGLDGTFTTRQVADIGIEDGYLTDLIITLIITNLLGHICSLSIFSGVLSTMSLDYRYSGVNCQYEIYFS